MRGFFILGAKSWRPLSLLIREYATGRVSILRDFFDVRLVLRRALL